MHPSPDGPLADLEALAARSLDWSSTRIRSLPDAGHARHAAVLVLFGVLDDVPAATGGRVPQDLDVLLVRRASTLGSHPGQIAFPGGRLDETDADATAAALREAVEETGVDPGGVRTLGTLPEIPLAVSNHLVTPVLAWWTRPSEVVAIDHAETVEVFRVPVAELVHPANRAVTVHGEYRMPAFTVGGRLVWGFTALVLARLFDELGWAEPWDQDRVVQPDS
ncbi:NUDIX hydrolase [Microterricola viridarii]|uniref:ADP-ribose pyrophosphatase YjhB, NUDIX family n=1 Tax=Microterricola viridarii TaxID=412690 RepID=A0A1H1TSW2_9MICO|nr:CoA pyrophosphatase [Microterricola viridarii]SDS63415.1 ADP-ribose pyrophosphatase YjhB, NUDIX family [Microterricola viridarii]